MVSIYQVLCTCLIPAKNQSWTQYQDQTGVQKGLIKYPTPVPAWYDRKKIGSNIYMPPVNFLFAKFWDIKDFATITRLLHPVQRLFLGNKMTYCHHIYEEQKKNLKLPYFDNRF